VQSVGAEETKQCPFCLQTPESLRHIIGKDCHVVNTGVTEILHRLGLLYAADTGLDTITLLLVNPLPLPIPVEVILDINQAVWWTRNGLVHGGLTPADAPNNIVSLFFRKNKRPLHRMHWEHPDSDAPFDSPGPMPYLYPLNNFCRADAPLAEEDSDTLPCQRQALRRLWTATLGSLSEFPPDTFSVAEIETLLDAELQKLLPHDEVAPAILSKKRTLDEGDFQSSGIDCVHERSYNDGSAATTSGSSLLIHHGPSGKDCLRQVRPCVTLQPPMPSMPLVLPPLSNNSAFISSAPSPSPTSSYSPFISVSSVMITSDLPSSADESSSRPPLSLSHGFKVFSREFPSSPRLVSFPFHSASSHNFCPPPLPQNFSFPLPNFIEYPLKNNLDRQPSNLAIVQPSSSISKYIAK
jgi:hypothetical protein